MAGVNFTGAKYFSINGGNFSEVKGNMNTYHITGAGSIPSAQAFDQLPGNRETRRERKARIQQQYQRGQGLLPGAYISPVSDSGSSSSSSSSRSSRSSRSSIPSTVSSPLRGPVSNDAPASSAHETSSTTSTQPTSTYHSPAHSDSSLGSDISGLEDDSPPSRYSTPETSVDEAHQGTSIPPEQPLDELSPLTNSLGLSRFTPANHFQPLAPPSEITTPQMRHSEIQPMSRVESRASAYQPPQTARMSTGPPPIPPRPAGFYTPRARELGPPPPIPPRPTNISPQQSYTTPAPATPQPLPPATPALSDIEDPSIRFAHLQAHRQTKGYSSGLGSPLNQPQPQHPPQAPNLNGNSDPNSDQLQRSFTHRNDLQIYPSTPSTVQPPTSPPPIPLRSLPSTSSNAAPSVLGSPEPNSAPSLDQDQRGRISNWASGIPPERVQHHESHPTHIGGGFVLHPGILQQPPSYLQHAPPPSFMHGFPMNPQYSQQWGPARHQHRLPPHQQQHYQNDYQNYWGQDRGYVDGPFRLPPPGSF